MNRFIFGINNISDKIVKITRSPGMLGFYLNTYLFSKFKRIDPDVYIVSYPKCGSTWIRIAIKKYLELSNFRQDNIKDGNVLNLGGGKTLKFEHDQGTWVPVPRRVDQLNFNASKYSGKKVCFVVRNPCDVLVSSWHHLKYRENIYSKRLSEFIRDNTLGIHKVLAFMNMWTENMNVPADFFLITYEELRNAPEESFRAIYSFIGLEIDTSIIKAVVEETSFENMKNMEMQGSLAEPWMNIGSDKSEKSMKIRRGKVGGYKDELSPEDIAYLDNEIKKTISKRLPYGQKTG